MKKVHRVLPKDKGGEAKRAAIAALKACFLAGNDFEKGMEAEME